MNLIRSNTDESTELKGYLRKKFMRGVKNDRRKPI